MPKDPIQDVARLVEEVVNTHGAPALLAYLSNAVIWELVAAIPAIEGEALQKADTFDRETVIKNYNWP